MKPTLNFQLLLLSASASPGSFCSMYRSNRARPRLLWHSPQTTGGLYYALLSVGDNAAGATMPNPLDAPAADEHILVDGLDYTIPMDGDHRTVDSQGMSICF